MIITSLLSKGLDLLIAVVGIMAFKWKWQSSNKDMHDLIHEIEERDREIERLKIALHTYRLRYEAITNGKKKQI